VRRRDRSTSSWNSWKAARSRIAWLLRRCLEKDPRRRLHDIADARIELDEALALRDGSAALESRGAPAKEAGIGRRERVAWIAAGLSIAVAAVALVTRGGGTGATPPGATLALRTSIVPPADVRLLQVEDPSDRVGLSPDGRRVVLLVLDAAGETRLWVRPLDGLAGQLLSGTEGARHPFWSPDSRSIAFMARPNAVGLISAVAKLKRVDLDSGEVRTLGEVTISSTGAWGPDDTILFTPSGSSPIHRVSASGGATSAVTALDQGNGDVQHVNPHFLPDGRHFLYAVIGNRATSATDPRAVYVGSLTPGESPRRLLPHGTNAKYASGHILFVRGGQLLAQPFDLDRLELQPGVEPVALATGVQDGGGAAAISVSQTGLVAYHTVVPVRTRLVWFDRAGTRMGTLGGEADYADVALSHDGLRAAVSQLDPSAGTRDIWIFDVSRGVPDRITSTPVEDYAPVWSPTGDRLAFSSTRQGRIDLYETTAAGADLETPLATTGLAIGKFAAHWSPGGDLAFVAGHRVIARSDLWILPTSGDRTPRALLDSPAIETQPRFSPDGRWLAYTSNRTGRLEVYVRPYPGTAGAEGRRVTVDGGQFALWHKDGSELFFLSLENDVMAAAVTASPAGFQVGAIRKLFRIPAATRRVRLDGYPYAVSPDGRKFLVNLMLDETAPPAITLLANWPAIVSKR
jgi:Tol biopolymer transport system component